MLEQYPHALIGDMLEIDMYPYGPALTPVQSDGRTMYLSWDVWDELVRWVLQARIRDDQRRVHEVQTLDFS